VNRYPSWYLVYTTGLDANRNQPRLRPNFPIWKLPLEIRQNIYSCFTDALHGNERQADPAKELRPTDGMRMALRQNKIHFWVASDKFQMEDVQAEPKEEFCSESESDDDDEEEENEFKAESDLDSDYDDYEEEENGEDDSEAELDSGDDDYEEEENGEDDSEAELDSGDDEVVARISEPIVQDSDYQLNDDDEENEDDASIDSNDGDSVEEDADSEDDNNAELGGCTVSAELIESHPDFRPCPCGCETHCCDAANRSVYETIRNLALTSSRMAQELGEFIWQNASAEFDSITTFLIFANQRPAALDRLRHIIVEVDYNGMAGDTSKDDIQAMLDVISTRMNLVSFGIHVYIHAETLDDETLESKNSRDVAVKMEEWAPLLSSLEATRFLVHVSHAWDWRGPDRAVLERYKSLAQDMAHWLEIIWKPDYITRSVDSEMAEYLEERNRPQQPAPKV